ncbi:hypothetical protein FNV43_RR03220 [Rhamnella rubrinervis]|uniref:Auxin-responsive protein n=1 Tax=Rhamnella rubrinervis TaxID=2594499 RepID=A0A8K0HHK9_9ROSA|nr:hypothetical protein FNV43_RR03220 [Rhamnella rubrinervis]
MNGGFGFDLQRQDSLERRSSSWQEIRRHHQLVGTTASAIAASAGGGGGGGGGGGVSCSFMGKPNNSNNIVQGFSGMLDHDDLVSTVVPAVTVVLEGRSICQRISLHKHASYQSLAKALRQMFVDGGDAAGVTSDGGDNNFDLSNAVPGHVIAYEDIENDLLLAGDLNWKDFVRVAKRIRILPAKANSKRGRGMA